MKKFVDYKKEVLADPNKDFASSMSAVAAFAVDEAKEADINLDDLDLFIGTAQYAQANGGGKAAMKDANTLDDDAKRNTAGQKQDDVKKNVENFMCVCVCVCVCVATVYCCVGVSSCVKSPKHNRTLPPSDKSELLKVLLLIFFLHDIFFF